MQTKTTILMLSLTSLFFLFSCEPSSSDDIIKNIDPDLLIVSDENEERYFVSNIYKDKDLGEVFWEKSSDNIVQISDEKQNISTLVLNKDQNQLFYTQSQTIDKMSKVLKPVLINAPSRFSDYVIKSYDFNKGVSSKSFDLTSQNILGTVENIGLLNDGATLAFQTNYGKIFLIDTNNFNQATRFSPQSNEPEQYQFDDLYRLKTDGHHTLYFDAKTGYKSPSDSTFVYSTFSYDVKTKEIKRVNK